jgi:hypothetical protein
MAAKRPVGMTQSLSTISHNQKLGIGYLGKASGIAENNGSSVLVMLKIEKSLTGRFLNQLLTV